MWPKVQDFLQDLPAFSLLLDAGCGNGKNMQCPGFIGSDRATSFCLLAKTETKNDTFVSDISQDTGLSVRDGAFDAAISIAVIHHLPTDACRRNALRQIARTLKPDGLALIYVWAYEQTEGSVGARKFQSQDVLVPWHFQTKRFETSESPVCMEKLDRYYHVFTKEEFENLVVSVSDYFQLLDLSYDSNNWGARIRRTSKEWRREDLESIE